MISALPARPALPPNDALSPSGRAGTASFALPGTAAPDGRQADAGTGNVLPLATADPALARPGLFTPALPPATGASATGKGWTPTPDPSPSIVPPSAGGSPAEGEQALPAILVVDPVDPPGPLLPTTGKLPASPSPDGSPAKPAPTPDILVIGPADPARRSVASTEVSKLPAAPPPAGSPSKAAQNPPAILVVDPAPAPAGEAPAKEVEPLPAILVVDPDTPPPDGSPVKAATTRPAILVPGPVAAPAEKTVSNLPGRPDVEPTPDRDVKGKEAPPAILVVDPASGSDKEPTATTRDAETPPDILVVDPAPGAPPAPPPAPIPASGPALPCGFDPVADTGRGPKARAVTAEPISPGRPATVADNGSAPVTPAAGPPVPNGARPAGPAPVPIAGPTATVATSAVRSGEAPALPPAASAPASPPAETPGTPPAADPARSRPAVPAGNPTPTPPPTTSTPPSSPLPSPPLSPTVSSLPASGPARQVFAAAIDRSRRAAFSTSEPVAQSPGLASAAPLAPATPAGIEVAEQVLDLSAARWTQDAVTRIERMLDRADAADTRVRLRPDALGSVDVSVRNDGAQVHVHFRAEVAETRQLLRDAAPRLAEAAEARGLRLGDTIVGDGSSGGGSSANGQPREQRPAPVVPLSPRRAPAAPATITTDQRLA